MKIILASQSPRRKELLTNMGLEFEIVVSDCEENTEKTNPLEVVEEISARKAMDVFEKLTPDIKDDCLLIAADTLVFVDRERLGKPADEAMAAEMIGKIAGRNHDVITGVTLIKSKDGRYETVSFAESTHVTVANMSKKEILDYISTGEPMDKAGAYAIQGKFAKHITAITGDYSNVVGLPVARLYYELTHKGWL